MIGCKRVAVTRAFRKLKEAGAVDLEDRRIVVRGPRRPKGAGRGRLEDDVRSRLVKLAVAVGLSRLNFLADLLRKHLLGTRVDRARNRPGRQHAAAPAHLVRNPGGCDP